MVGVRQVAVAGTLVEVEQLGAGEAVVVVQTALTVDELRPLSLALADAGDLEVWHLHRRGYGANGPAPSAASVHSDADLVAAVVGELALGPVHLVGASYSAAVALTLAGRHPAAVRSLALVEPPPYATTGTADFRAATTELVALFTEPDGPRRALDRIMGLVDGPGWRADAERDLPGSVAAMERDAATFFEADLPALLEWRFDEAEAKRVRCPTLLVGGGASRDWFTQMLDRLERELPHTSRLTVPDAGHTAALTHAADVAAAVRAHVRAVSPGTGAREGGSDPS